MKQKPFAKNNPPEDYIETGLKKAQSAVNLVFLQTKSGLDHPLLKDWDIYKHHEHYLAFARKGELTKPFEDVLVDKYFHRLRDSKKDSIESIETAHSIELSLGLLVSMAAYYSAMARVFSEQGDSVDMAHYLIKFAEVNGMLHRLHSEVLHIQIKLPLAEVFTELKVIDDFKKDDSKRKSDIAKMRHANDPKAKEKELVKECWFAWQDDPSLYASLSDFARDMADKCDHLKPSRETISRWISKVWRAEYDHARRVTT